MSLIQQTTTDINCPSSASQVFYLIVNWSGIIGNLLLFSIITVNKSTELQQYSFILRVSCVIDIFSSFVQFLTQARPEMIGDKRLLTFSMDGAFPKMMAETRWFQGERLAYMLVPEFVGCYFSVCFCWIPFFYRYLLICRQRTLKKFQLIGIILFVFVLVTVASFAVCQASVGVYDINTSRIPAPDPNCTRFVPQFSMSTNKDVPNAVFYYGIYGYSLMLILTIYLVAFFLAYRIHAFLKLQVNMSYVQKRVQKQVSQTLAAQAVGQLLAFYGPATAFAVTGTMQIESQFTIKLLFTVYSLVPLVNVLSALSFITVYRNAFVTMCSQSVYIVGTSLGLGRFVQGIPEWQAKVTVFKDNVVSSATIA